MVRYVKTPVTLAELVVSYNQSFSLARKVIDAIDGGEVAILLDDERSRILGKIRSTVWLFDRINEEVRGDGEGD